MNPGALKPKSAHNNIYPLEPLTEQDLEACDGISKAIDRWLKEYTKPGQNGISEADKAYLAHLYAPQGQLVTKLLEQINKEPYA